MLSSQLLALQDPYLISPAIGYILIGIFGVIIGSFLNVVIHRVPREESILFQNSLCPPCGALIAFYDNIPVLSYIAVRDKYRGCKKHISVRYPYVELMN